VILLFLPASFVASSGTGAVGFLPADDPSELRLVMRMGANQPTGYVVTTGAAKSATTRLRNLRFLPVLS